MAKSLELKMALYSGVRAVKVEIRGGIGDLAWLEGKNMNGVEIGRWRICLARLVEERWQKACKDRESKREKHEGLTIWDTKNMEGLILVNFAEKKTW